MSMYVSMYVCMCILYSDYVLFILRKLDPCIYIRWSHWKLKI